MHDDLFSALQHLKFRKHEVILFHVTDKKLELDFEFENRPYHFIDMESGEELKLNPNQVKEQYLQSITKYKEEIPYFKYSNPVKHFFDHTTQNVEVLISRNKNRLLKEITESKELMLLLAKSTRRDLDEKEKKKVKKQLLDICKTIPSLTIFLLPGGSLLLPILIKFIPKLLPSAFNENLEEE